MHLSDIDYELPEELIAQTPAEPRDSARLLVASNGGRSILHRRVSDLVEYVGDGDLLVINETRVLPGRLPLRRSTGGAVEVLLLEPRDAEEETWEALVRPGRKMRDGERLIAEDGGEFLEVVARSESGDTFIVRPLRGDDIVGRRTAFEVVGNIPLPPYITTPVADTERYQTVYSRRAASAAAPTAGLHFTSELMRAIEAKGARFATVELIVGLDTFKPVESENPLDHRIHTETYSVPEATWEAVGEARRVIAVGTTSCRALESVAATQRLSGRTDLFITPGFQWKVVDVMMTNFHMPRTTLLLMVSSFIGNGWRDIYAEAVRQRYRFLSFGDAMLLERQAS